MLELIAAVVVFFAGLFLASLGAVALAMPALARRFLLGFATTPGLHFLELALRLFVGTAFVFAAPGMRYSLAFSVFGWIVVLTTLVLVLIPWRWHRRIAQQSVPPLLRLLPLFGLASLGLGSLVLFALFAGAA
jgi:uncharacterized protein YjeT (DUF2065 family)